MVRTDGARSVLFFQSKTGLINSRVDSKVFVMRNPESVAVFQNQRSFHACTLGANYPARGRRGGGGRSNARQPSWLANRPRNSLSCQRVRYRTGLRMSYELDLRWQRRARRLRRAMGTRGGRGGGPFGRRAGRRAQGGRVSESICTHRL